MLGEGKALLEEEGHGETVVEALALARAVTEGKALREFEEQCECVREPKGEREDDRVRGAVGEEAEFKEWLACGVAVDCRAVEAVASPSGAREGDAAEEGVTACEDSAVREAASLGVPPDAEALEDAEGCRDGRPEAVKMDVAVAVEAALPEGDDFSSSDAEAGALRERRDVLDTTTD